MSKTLPPKNLKFASTATAKPPIQYGLNSFVDFNQTNYLNQLDIVKYQKGFEGVGITLENGFIISPTVEAHNFLMMRADASITDYIRPHIIDYWDDTVKYNLHSYAYDPITFIIYQSLVEDNVGNALSNGAYWYNTGQTLNTYINNISVLNNTTVKITGNQTIAGIKSFTSPVVIPNGVLSDEAVNRGQLDGVQQIALNNSNTLQAKSRSIAAMLWTGNNTLTIGVTAIQMYNGDVFSFSNMLPSTNGNFDITTTGFGGRDNVSPLAANGEYQIFAIAKDDNTQWGLTAVLNTSGGLLVPTLTGVTSSAQKRRYLGTIFTNSLTQIIQFRQDQHEFNYYNDVLIFFQDVPPVIPSSTPQELLINRIPWINNIHINIIGYANTGAGAGDILIVNFNGTLEGNQYHIDHSDIDIADIVSIGDAGRKSRATKYCITEDRKIKYTIPASTGARNLYFFAKGWRDFNVY